MIQNSIYTIYYILYRKLTAQLSIGHKIVYILLGYSVLFILYMLDTKIVYIPYCIYTSLSYAEVLATAQLFVHIVYILVKSAVGHFQLCISDPPLLDCTTEGFLAISLQAIVIYRFILEIFTNSSCVVQSLFYILTKYNTAQLSLGVLCNIS